MSTPAQRLVIAETQKNAERAAILAKEKQEKELAKSSKLKELSKDVVVTPEPATPAKESNHVSKNSKFNIILSSTRVGMIMKSVLRSVNYKELAVLRAQQSVVNKKLFSTKTVAGKESKANANWVPPTEEEKVLLLAEKQALSDKIATLDRDEYQLRQDSDVLVACLLDMVMKSFVDFVYANTLTAGRTTAILGCTMDVENPKAGHLKLSMNDYWGLLASTSVIRNYDSFEEVENAKKRRAANAAETAAKVAAKAALVELGKDPKKEPRKPRVVKDSDSTPTLNSYMTRICASMKKNGYVTVKSSEHLTSQMATITTEIITNITKAVRTIVINNKLRSATTSIVETAIMNSLYTAGCSEDTCALVREALNSKLEIHDHQNIERAARANTNSEARMAALSKEEKTILIQKQIDEASALKARRIEAKKKRANNLLTEAKTIQTDNSTLAKLAQRMDEVIKSEDLVGSTVTINDVTPPTAAVQKPVA